MDERGNIILYGSKKLRKNGYYDDNRPTDYHKRMPCGAWSSAKLFSLFTFHQRESNDIADGRGIRDDHENAIDPQTHATRGRHAHADCFDKIHIDGVMG